MQSCASSARRQAGAVVVMFALMLVVLFAFMGFVLDLGHVYVRKTELQNAADAAAIAAAKELNGTAAGITAARDRAIALAAANASDFDATSVAITAANLRFGPSSNGPWDDYAAALAAPASKFFVKVDTTGIAQGTRPTWFMQVADSSATTTTASGLAVAGRQYCQALPLFTCARPGSTAPNWGFEPGHAYKFNEPSSSGDIGPGNVGFMDPVPPGAPKLINGTDEMRDIICSGVGYCLSPGNFSSLTQGAFGTMMRALNTRFDDFTSLPSKLTPQVCRPDTNVKEYRAKEELKNGATAWMSPSPDRQAEEDPAAYSGAPSVPTPPGAPLGVHWAGVRPTAGIPANVSSNGNYPASGTPYGQSEGSIYHEPPSNASKAYAQSGRRLVTVAIADNCYPPNPVINGSGATVHIVAFGRFLLPVKAVATGSDKGFYAEFIDMVTMPNVSTLDIKLYQ